MSELIATEYKLYIIHYNTTHCFFQFILTNFKQESVGVSMSKDYFFHTLKSKDGTKVTVTLYSYGKYAEKEILRMIKERSLQI